MVTRFVACSRNRRSEVRPFSDLSSDYYDIGIISGKQTASPWRHGNQNGSICRSRIHWIGAILSTVRS